MDDLFTLNPNASDLEIDDGISGRAAKQQAIIVALMAESEQDEILISKKILYDNLWALHGYSEEISYLAGERGKLKNRDQSGTTAK